MKLVLVLISAFLLISIVPATTQSQTSKRRISASKRRITSAKTVRKLPGTSSAITTPSGLIYVTTRRSEGRQPKPGEKVVVHYTGLLPNGIKFDSSLDRGQPFAFELGLGRVIKGWDEGIAKLRVGDQATLIIPPHLGYGEKGAGDIIPPGATLIFIVELVGIEEKPALN